MRRFSIITALCLCLCLSLISIAVEAKYNVRQIERAVEALTKQLKSSNSSIRLSAVKKLTRIDHRKAVKPLIYALNDANSFVRIYACRGLGDLKYYKAVNPLIRRLKMEKELFVQREAIIALGKLGDERARWVLKKFTKNHNLTLKIEAEKALKKLTNGVNPF